jgi:hypothetical protein
MAISGASRIKHFLGFMFWRFSRRAVMSRVGHVTYSGQKAPQVATCSSGRLHLGGRRGLDQGSWLNFVMLVCVHQTTLNRSCAPMIAI